MPPENNHDHQSPHQHSTQSPPGREHQMEPAPDWEYRQQGSGRLAGRVAIITGADSGIGRAIAVAYAAEGAHIVCAYLSEHTDAQETQKLVEEQGQSCLLIAGDVGDPTHATRIVEATLTKFGQVNILVNNAAEQTVKNSLLDITPEQLERTFRTNIFGYFYLTKAVLPHLTDGDCIINTTSVTAYRGSDHLIDYAATKGAIVAFTRSLALSVAPHIRVNAVAPGPVWTPLIISTFPKEEIKDFGKDTPLDRPGQPNEIAPAYVFLASEDASYITGQVIHPNGGEIVNT